MLVFAFTTDNGSSTKSSLNFKAIAFDVYKKTFKIKCYLTVHQWIHSGKKILQIHANVCNKKFYTEK